ncbi:MAG: histidinol-phosphate transaminase [Slackia sp.]|nr:histidinol-phosphate transaminase [Slackia sp.]
MASDIRIRLRDDLADLKPYDPGLSAQEIVLSANENPFGMPDCVREAALSAVADVAFERYPDPLADGLRDDIAAWHGVERSQVIVGNGGDELIFDLLLAFGGRGRVLLDCPPTFSIYALYAKLTDTEIVAIPRNAADFSLDRKAVEHAAESADIVMITSPNNPTGNTVDPDWVASLAERARGIVVVDEAYIEFADEGSSCAGLMRDHGNVAILRTFSKAFALAGVRCGYLLAPEGVVDGIAAVRQPYSVDAIGQAVSRVVVAHRDAYEDAIATIKEERERLTSALRDTGCIEVWPSQGNFVLVRMPGAHAAYERLRDEFSILTRDFSRSPFLSDCLRITVGTPQENDRVIAALASLGKESS